MRASWWSSTTPEGLAAKPSPLRVLLLAAAVPFLLRILKLPELRFWLEPRGPLPPSPAPGEVARMVQRIDRLLAAGRPVVRSGCLTRGVTLYYFLRRAGADVSLCFGMGEVQGRFEGHCWLVCQGEPLAERRDPRPLFAETWRIDPLPPGPLFRERASVEEVQRG
ncbi:MAG TPA: lasso peptide biosynthesis B2 protein [Thermoanaerobaculia bacterium]|nr:lasso peptide biosynthesis B2 protein [Thermoanaerobaculia bacterium]